MSPTRDFVLLSLAIGSLSFTISKSTMPLVMHARRWLAARAGWLKELLHCPYCVSHWVAAVVMLIYNPHFLGSGSPAVDWVLTWLALVGGAMVPIFALLFISRVNTE